MYICEHKILVLFSLQLLSEIFLMLRGIQQLIFVNVKLKLEFSQQTCEKILKYQIS
jgi:hypothetical protein